MDLYLCENIARREDAYALLAHAVRRRWGLVELPRIARGEQGKPFFPAFPQYHFNLSHSGSFALCALDTQPVGVDIEVIRPHHPRLHERICSEVQLAWLEKQPDRQTALLRLWTLKESRVKYTGLGLTTPLRSIDIPLSDEPRSELDGLVFQSFSCHDWCAALCGHTDPASIVTI
ncbi:MAG: 4'-phosphopantetheinyl transferase superfamily protein [Oscillospiraceae bacterium]|nr:4'-phosphopantetheinyl transferase superfamily protein [Oscillospiraceae bacterium]